MAERHRVECPEQVTRARCALDLSLFTVQLLEEKAWVEVDRASPKRSHECTDSPAHSLIRRPVAQLRLLSEMGDKIRYLQEWDTHSRHITDFGASMSISMCHDYKILISCRCRSLRLFLRSANEEGVIRVALLRRARAVECVSIILVEWQSLGQSSRQIRVSNEPSAHDNGISVICFELGNSIVACVSTSGEKLDIALG